jgi:hypothetical protein
MPEQEYELVVKLIVEADFAAVFKELNKAGIPFLSSSIHFRLQELQDKRLREITYFVGDETTIWQVIHVNKYPHPSITTVKYSLEIIYRLMFKEEIGDILERMHGPSADFPRSKVAIDNDIRILLSKLEHAAGILGEEFLTMHYDGRELREIMNEMQQFLRRRVFR